MFRHSIVGASNRYWQLCIKQVWKVGCPRRREGKKQLKFNGDGVNYTVTAAHVEFPLEADYVFLNVENVKAR